MIKINHLQKAFPDGGVILSDFNAEIQDGEIVAVLGPSGCGKSTFLRCLNLLDPPTGGEILLDGECITAPGYPPEKVRSKIGMVFQSYSLFQHLTVIENLMLPQITVLKRSRQEAYDKGMDLLASVGMQHKSMSLPKALSGGQRQRVAIARTLAMDPEIILMDEPTSALDPSMVDEIKSVIKNVASTGITMLIVTHDMSFARQVATKVFYLDQKILYESGTPEEIFERPQKKLTRRFMKRLKILEQDVDIRDYDYYALMGSISEFGTRNQLSARLVRGIQSVTEELLGEILPPYMDTSLVKLAYEYTERTSELVLTLEYHGSPRDPLSVNHDASSAEGPSAEDFPYMILRSYIREHTFTAAGSQSAENRLDIVFRYS